ASMKNTLVPDSARFAYPLFSCSGTLAAGTVLAIDLAQYVMLIFCTGYAFIEAKIGPLAMLGYSAQAETAGI
ncbi:hypothetical protein N9H39_05295, partial [Gammaproteobacteria bacterium]|nr:hypothetical protein [Gammaproteobacteria bacterium]